MCPIVPTFTWGFDRSNFCLAMIRSPVRKLAGTGPRRVQREGEPRPPFAHPPRTVAPAKPALGAEHQTVGARFAHHREPARGGFLPATFATISSAIGRGTSS